MPAPWAAWARILSCKQQSSITTVQDPHKKAKKNKKKKVKKKAKGGSNSTSPANSNNSVVGSPSPPPLQRKGYGGGYGHNNNGNPARRRRRSMGASSRATSGPPGASCCNNLKSVVHGNTRVVHRGDQDSPLPRHAQEAPIQEEQFQASRPHHSHVPTQTRPPPPKKLSTSSCYDFSPPSSLSDSAPPEPSFFRHAPSLSSRHGIVCHSPAPTLQPTTGDVRQSPAGLADEHHPHHHHSVTELRDGDSARSIVEIIFQTSWMRQGMRTAKPEGIYKVHNSPKALAKFEEYRESVKAKASKAGRKNSRCLVDGNELLRFFSTTVSCNMDRSSSWSSSWEPISVSEESVPVPLCTSSSCGVCCILRHGFPRKGYPGIYTNASSGRAHETGCDDDGGQGGGGRRAMLVCRVIAGRVKRMGLESSQDGSIPTVYDSVAGEPTPYTELEELLVFNPRAVLPCFIVIYSCCF